MAESIKRRINALSSGRDRVELRKLLEAMYADFGGLNASTTNDFASIAIGAQDTLDVTVTGAALGDFAVASLEVDVVDLVVSASVTAADTVTVVLFNNTAGAIDLASTTVRVRVFPATLATTD